MAGFGAVCTDILSKVARIASASANSASANAVHQMFFLQALNGINAAYLAD